MLLYKFKSAQNARYALDIAIHQRLYCARYSDLNDPFEGQYRALIGDPSRGFGSLFSHGFGHQVSRVAYFELAKSPLDGPSRVCSLSAEWQDVRMWAHYADSSQGLAFEFEIDPAEPELHQVAYVDALPKLNFGLLGLPNTIDALTCKSTHWRYESEWRFISDREYIELPGQLRRILLGSRISAEFRDAVLELSAPGIDVHMVGLDPRGISMAIGARLSRHPR